jgi:2-polyprenyl-6-methoxyphenol hydroxylase-like FAD-dependent oxidoreductase
MKIKVAIIGGGVAGSSVALYLAQQGLDVSLFEQESSLVSGPPMCHLHAGGNLYPDISDEQCRKLLKQSIELIAFYPYAIDYRPTLLSYPKEVSLKAESLLPRLEMLQKYYQTLVDKGVDNKKLGEPKAYYKLFEHSDIKRLLLEKNLQKNSFSKWMQSAAATLDLNKLQNPLIMVQEYGLNLFRIAASAELMLQRLANVSLRLNTKVKNISRKDAMWSVEGESFDYLINAAGFRSGIVDDMLGYHRKRLVEFKAAYVTQWHTQKGVFPEIIFQGKRGTPQGMGQFTPYPAGYYQLHGMTQEITLYANGLVKNPPSSSQPQLAPPFLQKIEQNWEWSEVEQRTDAAIKHISNYIPAFQSANLAAKPLYGAQQIPGEDATLRASEVSFENENYARCETVKASSVLTMARDIYKDILQKKALAKELKKEQLPILTEPEVSAMAQSIAKMRNYPPQMAGITSKEPATLL